jgi:glycosyltransferase involved in cell wall biosynthesis
VLIIDFTAHGHHPFHVRSMLDSGLADDADIIVASQPKMFEHPVIAQCQARFQPYHFDLGSNDALVKITSPGAVVRRSWLLGQAYRRVYFELSRQAPIDFVIVAYLDDCLLGLAAPRTAFGNTPWLSITMRTTFHYHAMGVRAPKQRFAGMRRWLTYRVLRQKTMAALLTIDPTLALFASQQRDPIFRKIVHVPDPATLHSALLPKPEARQRLGIPADCSLVLMYGAITERKGTYALLRAAAMPECSRQIHLLFAGRIWDPEQVAQSPAWLTLAAQGRLHVLDGFVDDARERLLMAAADCMWVGYIDFYGMSGVMALAGRHAMPVIASDYGVVGYLARKHDLGVLIEPRDNGSIVDALNRLVNEPEAFGRAGSHGVALFEGHSPEVLKRLVVDTVRRSWK